MVTKQPRLNGVLEQETFKAVQKLSKREGVSMSLLARDLIRDALERSEDYYWASEAEERMKTLDRKKLVSHKDAWQA